MDVCHGGTGGFWGGGAPQLSGGGKGGGFWKMTLDTGDLKLFSLVAMFLP